MNDDRFFLDTNIFVYSFDFTAPGKQKIARQLIDEALRTRTGRVSYQVIQEFYNVSFRKFATPLSEGEAALYFNNILFPLYSVAFSPGLLHRAFRIQNAHRITWYDSLIVAAALESESGTLYSEDFQHGTLIEGVRVRNPFLTS